MPGHRGWALAGRRLPKGVRQSESKPSGWDWKVHKAKDCAHQHDALAPLPRQLGTPVDETLAKHIAETMPRAARKENAGATAQWRIQCLASTSWEARSTTTSNRWPAADARGARNCQNGNRSRAVSPRSWCEKIMKASASATGIAPTALLLPTNAITTHSAIKQEVTHRDDLPEW